MQPDLPFIAELAATQAAANTEARITRHLESLACCWPEWKGPRVEHSIHGRCSVGSTICRNLTFGDDRYHYMAPCRIESISPDGRTITAVVEYESGSFCEWMNGQRLQLDITEVWAPVAHLTALRHAVA